MNGTKTLRVATAVLAAALMASVAVPAFAAGSRRAGASAGSTGTAMAALRPNAGTGTGAGAVGTGPGSAGREQLQNRIGNVLRARKARFDAVFANLTLRVSRVTALTDKLETLGGDVTVARAKLAEAAMHRDKAKEFEAAAIAEFNAIPGAADRRSAFRSAKASARLAVAELKAERVALREAAQSLRATIAELKASTTPTGTVDAQ